MIGCYPSPFQKLTAHPPRFPRRSDPRHPKAYVLGRVVSKLPGVAGTGRQSVSNGEPWQVAKRQDFFQLESWIDPWRWTPANGSRFFIENSCFGSSVETFSWRWVLAFVCSKFWNSRNSVCVWGALLVIMQFLVPFSRVGGPFLLPMFLRLTLDRKKGQHMGLSQHRLHFAVPCFLMTRMWQNLRMDVVTCKGVGRLPMFTLTNWTTQVASFFLGLDFFLKSEVFCWVVVSINPYQKWGGCNSHGFSRSKRSKWNSERWIGSASKHITYPRNPDPSQKS